MMQLHSFLLCWPYVVTTVKDELEMPRVSASILLLRKLCREL